MGAAHLAASRWDDLVPAIRLFEAAFARDEGAKSYGTRYQRARRIASAWTALASGGATGSDLSDAECARLRALSREWVHEELDLIEVELVRPGLTLEAAEAISREFHAMELYGYYAPIREPEYLERMPSEEAHLCRALWARIRGLEATLVELIGA